MQFIDEAKIYLKAGNGGGGAVSFRREKFIPFGGPDGGDGGRGGSIVFIASANLNTLIDFRYRQHFKAKTGHHGSGRQRSGAAAEDIVVDVPVGTQIWDEKAEEMLADLQTAGERLVLAKGGRGGLGNMNFKSSVNQAPRYATPGTEGEERWVWLKLKLLCDAGLLGLPNAGKSTFLATVSRAKPKIADYPFTTLKPQLGVVKIDDRDFVMADIPGLIEGASEGHGLGIRFLKHVERCRVLLHLVDATGEDVAADYRTIRSELAAYSDRLSGKQEVLALSKADALDAGSLAEKKAQLEEASGGDVLILSSASGLHVNDTLRALLGVIDEEKRLEAFTETEAAWREPEESDDDSEE